MADPENTPPGQAVKVSDPETERTVLFKTVASGDDTTVNLISLEVGVISESAKQNCR